METVIGPSMILAEHPGHADQSVHGRRVSGVSHYSVLTPSGDVKQSATFYRAGKKPKTYRLTPSQGVRFRGRMSKLTAKGVVSKSISKGGNSAKYSDVTYARK